MRSSCQCRVTLRKMLIQKHIRQDSLGVIPAVTLRWAGSSGCPARLGISRAGLTAVWWLRGSRVSRRDSHAATARWSSCRPVQATANPSRSPGGVQDGHCRGVTQPVRGHGLGSERRNRPRGRGDMQTETLRSAVPAHDPSADVEEGGAVPDHRTSSHSLRTVLVSFVVPTLARCRLRDSSLTDSRSQRPSAAAARVAPVHHFLGVGCAAVVPTATLPQPLHDSNQGPARCMTCSAGGYTREKEPEVVRKPEGIRAPPCATWLWCASSRPRIHSLLSEYY